MKKLLVTLSIITASISACMMDADWSKKIKYRDELPRIEAHEGMAFGPENQLLYVSESYPAQNISDDFIHLTSLNIDGDILWEQLYDHDIWSMGIDSVHGIKDGWLLQISYRHDDSLPGELWKLDSRGNQVWVMPLEESLLELRIENEKIYAVGKKIYVYGFDTQLKLTLDYDGWRATDILPLEDGFIVTGVKHTLRYDNQGNEIWKSLNVADEEATNSKLFRNQDRILVITHGLGGDTTGSIGLYSETIVQQYQMTDGLNEWNKNLVSLPDEDDQGTEPYWYGVSAIPMQEDFVLMSSNGKHRKVVRITANGNVIWDQLLEHENSTANKLHNFPDDRFILSGSGLTQVFDDSGQLLASSEVLKNLNPIGYGGSSSLVKDKSVFVGISVGSQLSAYVARYSED